MGRKPGLAAAAALALAIESITVAFAGSSDSGSADHRVQVIRLLAEHRGPQSRLRQARVQRRGLGTSSG